MRSFSQRLCSWARLFDSHRQGVKPAVFRPAVGPAVLAQRVRKLDAGAGIVLGRPLSLCPVDAPRRPALDVPRPAQPPPLNSRALSSPPPCPRPSGPATPQDLRLAVACRTEAAAMEAEEVALAKYEEFVKNLNVSMSGAPRPRRRLRPRFPRAAGVPPAVAPGSGGGWLTSLGLWAEPAAPATCRRTAGARAATHRARPTAHRPRPVPTTLDLQPRGRRARRRLAAAHLLVRRSARVSRP